MDLIVGIVLRNLTNTSNSETVGICKFFEALSIGCRKTIFDVKKITYNMCSCDISCMSREMMEMDGLDSAKWQKSRGRDIDVILKILNEEKDKKVIVFLSK